MNRLLLLVPMLLAAPVSAQVDPAIHKLCVDVKDYAGCVQTKMSLSSTGKNTSIKTNDRNVQPVNTSEITITKQEYDECMATSKSLSDLTEAERQIAWEKTLNWKPGDPYTKPCRLPGKKSVARTGDGSQPDEPWVTDNVCPPGTRQYQKTALFGLIKGQKLCLSDYEAESLRAQQQRNIHNNIQNSMPRFVNCTSHAFGNYVSTSCY